ncbi:RES domain-containing protein [Bacillus thuringiensis]|uniref:RES domain-containing protein n=1 Tax=Bacillus thuringiensis TaxID=1428 RepID=UPI003399A901
MNCCVKCFEDVNVIEYIKSKRALGETCNYCGTKAELMVDISDLSEMFSRLFKYYKVTTEFEHFDPEDQVAADVGKSLWEWVQDSWNIFSELTDERLLYDIVNLNRDSQIDESTLFSDPTDSIMYDRKGGMWEALSYNLKYENRYFPKKNIDVYYTHEELLGELESLFKSITTIVNTENIFYRARIGNFTDSKQLNAPPEEKILKGGRVNPIGIRVLYSAIDIETAIAEVRPWKSAPITIACVRPKESLKLVDLSKISNRKAQILSSFFATEDLYSELDTLDLLSTLDKTLSEPVHPESSELEYIPSQYLTEFIKSLGYDGVIFKSSLGPGENYAFFEWDKFSYKPSKLDVIIIDYYEVNDMKYEFTSKLEAFMHSTLYNTI